MMPTARRFVGCANYQPGDGLLGYAGFCINCGCPASQHQAVAERAEQPPAAQRLGPVASACTALLDGLDDPVRAPAVRRGVLELAWTLTTDEQREHLAQLLYEITEAIS